jgi:hypothetical protein
VDASSKPQMKDGVAKREEKQKGKIKMQTTPDSLQVLSLSSSPLSSHLPKSKE